jgi:hypothetical protein
VPRLLSKIENVTVSEDSDAEFICKFVSNPVPSLIVWYQNEKEELSESEFISIVSSDGCTKLIIKNCRANDTGKNFIAKVVNDLGEFTSNKASLNVTCGPVFHGNFPNQSILREKEAKFECSVKGNPKPNITWLFNDKELTSRDGVRFEKDVAKDLYAMILPRVTTVGLITVKASNDFGTSDKTCQLDILDVPKALNKLENLTVNENESAKFVVKFSGNPKPQVKWFRDEEEIVVNEAYELEETGEDEMTLVIKACKFPENSGNYYAKISNAYGEVVTNKATMTINSKLI